MPEPTLILLSMAFVVVGAMFVLFPDPLLRLSQGLNRTLTVLDQKLMRHRYLVALIFFAVSYLLFNLALLMPELHG